MKTSTLRQKIVVLTGAGISKESGLDTFRDKDGMWQKHDAMRLSSIEGFEQEPQAVLDFYNARRKQLLEVEPNEAHRLLAELERWHDVTIITQNIDNLHERAGSTHVIHLHGELTKVTSSRQRIKEYPSDVPIRRGDRADDGSRLRPYIVWFGEYVPDMEMAERHVREADIFAVIGTSLSVYPAAGLTRYAHGSVPKFVVDPHLEVIPTGFTHIKANATSGMARLMEEIKRL